MAKSDFYPNPLAFLHFITTFATDINLMRIKLIGIKYEILRQGKGTGHTPNKLRTDGRAGADNCSDRPEAHRQDYAIDQECRQWRTTIALSLCLQR